MKRVTAYRVLFNPQTEDKLVEVKFQGSDLPTPVPVNSLAELTAILLILQHGEIDFHDYTEDFPRALEVRHKFAAAPK